MKRWTFGTPHEAQREVLVSPYRMIYYRGGLGAGKSWTGVMWAGAAILLHSPGVTGVILAPTYSMLDDVIRPQIEDLWPEDVVETWHGTKRSYTWPNGSEVLLRSADRPGRLRGIQVGWAWLDEPAEMKGEIWSVITGRLRARSRWVHQVLLTGTPSGYNWVHDAFGHPGERLEDGIHVVQARTEDNRQHLPQGYIESLRNLYSARLAAQELDGSVVHLDGLVFTEFDPKRHVVSCEWTTNHPTWAGVDFGYRKPAVTFWRKHPDNPNAWVCFDEIMPQDTTTEQLADRILAKGYNLQEAWCDPAGKAATTAGRTDVEAMRRVGIPAKYRTASRIRRIAFGLEVMRSALDPADGSEPRLYIHENITKGSRRGLFRALLSYQFRGNTEAPEKDGEYDHAIDCARYMLANTMGINHRTVKNKQERGPLPRFTERTIPV
tara:strand:- start:5064 stop:6371 length:1308 start_codon:yes stop_codon:yes gene_type:complete